MLCLYGLQLGISACRLTQGSGSADVVLVRITAGYICLPPDSRVRINKCCVCTDYRWVYPPAAWLKGQDQQMLCLYGLTLGTSAYRLTNWSGSTDVMLLRITARYIRLPPDSRVRINRYCVCTDYRWVYPPAAWLKGQDQQMLCLYGLPLGISACRLTQGSGSVDIVLVRITARYIRLSPDSRVRISRCYAGCG